MICCIVHICATSPQCESAYGWPDCWDMRKTCCTSCKDVCWPCLRFKVVSSDCWQQLMKFICPTEPCHVHFHFSTLNLPCWHNISPSTLERVQHFTFNCTLNLPWHNLFTNFWEMTFVHLHPYICTVSVSIWGRIWAKDNLSWNILFLSPAPTYFELIATTITILIVILTNVYITVGASLSPFPATNISISDTFSHLFEQLGSTHVYIAIYILFFIFIMFIFLSKNLNFTPFWAARRAARPTHAGRISERKDFQSLHQDGIGTFAWLLLLMMLLLLVVSCYWMDGMGWVSGWGEVYVE